MLIPMYVMVGLLGLWQIIQRLRRKVLISTAPIYLVGSFTVTFTVIVGAIAELGEQSRFRTMVDPIVTVMFVALVVPVVQRLYRQTRNPDNQSHEVAVGK
jgi:Co/Zn/Cd efflux system component